MACALIKVNTVSLGRTWDISQEGQVGSRGERQGSSLVSDSKLRSELKERDWG